MCIRDRYTPLGAQSAICGGGRYDGLVEEVGGPSTPGIGFAVGMERLLLALEMQNLIPEPETAKHVYIAAMGKEAEVAAVKLQKELRDREVPAEIDLQGKSLKGQMKHAGKSGAALVAIIGSSEMEEGVVQVKTMDNGEQVKVNVAEAADYMAKNL